MRDLVFAVILGLSVSFASSEALAQGSCPTGWVERDAAVIKLAESSQASVAMGYHNNVSVVEMFRTEDGSRWTLIQSNPNGCSRLIVRGQDWISYPPPKVGPRS